MKCETCGGDTTASVRFHADLAKALEAAEAESNADETADWLAEVERLVACQSTP